MGLDVGWRHGEDHMRTRHQITVQAANEALAGPDALLFDPDPKTTSGQRARVIGFSPTDTAVLVVILVRREDKPGSWWGANGWRAKSTNRRIYAEGSQRHE